MLQEAAPPTPQKGGLGAGRIEEQRHKAVRNMVGDSVRSFSTAGDRNSTAKSLSINGVCWLIKLAQFDPEARMI